MTVEPGGFTAGNPRSENPDASAFSLCPFLRWRWIYTRQWFGTKAWRVGLAFKRWRYDHGVAAAKRLCKGNRYGVHTESWPAHQPMGGQCFCSRVRRRLDFIPF